MSNLSPSFRQVAEIPEGAAHDTVRKAIKFLVYSTVDLQQAVPALNDKINSMGAPAASSSPSSTSSTVTVVTNGFPGLGGVNNQTGNTSYTTSSNDNGVLLLLNDASAVAVTLNSGVTTPFFLFITNTGAGTVTLTPSSGNINGASSLTLEEGYFLVAAFDGTDWWTSALLVVPQTFAAVSHEFLNAYDATTGDFTATQPAFSDISGTASPSQLPVATASALGVVEPDGATITIAAGVITSVPQVTFGSGAPSGTATTGAIYFDTASSPYAGYVYNGGWQAFS